MHKSYRALFSTVVLVIGGSGNAGAQSAPSTSARAAYSAPVAEVDPATSSIQGETYNMRLRNIEERVNDLKEKVFQSKARLIQLQEVVLHGAISGAKAVLVHRNEMGGTFRLTRIQYALDGAPIYNRVATGDELNAAEEIEIFNGSIAPGNHQVSVYLEYQGNGYGVFSYLKDYTFRVKSSQTLVAEEGKLTTAKIVGYEKGGLTTELKDRPQVRYEIDTGKPLGDDRALPSASKEAKPASANTQAQSPSPIVPPTVSSSPASAPAVKNGGTQP
ncbi:MAG: dihydrolipoamide acetyltransferase [Clostridia bacterium]|nr:dihydrolipoamide acetyltransferase [Deltaproteobacteria bacterium]